MSPHRLDSLLADHRALRELLLRLEHQLPGLKPGADHTFRSAAETICALKHAPAPFHAPLEAALFRQLQACHPGATDSVAQHEQQARRLRSHANALLDALHDVRVGAMSTSSPLIDQGREYCDAYRALMALEEDTLFPLLTRHLSDDDWDAQTKQVQAGHAGPASGTGAG